MTWVLLFFWYRGAWGLYYAGDYVTQKQCDEMAHRINVITVEKHPRDIDLDYICVQKPNPYTNINQIHAQEK